MEIYTYMCMYVNTKLFYAVLTHVVSLCQFLPSGSDTHVPKCAPFVCILPFSCASFVETTVNKAREKATYSARVHTADECGI